MLSTPTRAAVARAIVTVMLSVSSGAVHAQSLTPINRANLELAFDNVMAASMGTTAPDADFDGDGVILRDALGCLGELYEAAILGSSVKNTFEANVATINGLDGNIEATVPGFDLVAGYLATVICDEDSGQQRLIDFVDSFASMVGAGGVDGDPNTDSPTGASLLADAGLDCSKQELMYASLSACIDGVGLVVEIAGPDTVFVGESRGYIAMSVDSTDPMFIETHTYSSSNPAVLMDAGPSGSSRAFVGVSEGTAEVIAIGNTSGIEGSVTVTVLRAPSLFPITRANMELAFDNVFATIQTGFPEDVDINQNGILDRDEMGCFGAASESGFLHDEVSSNFFANVATVDSIDGDIEEAVPGYDLFMGYLTSVICDQDSSQQFVIDFIDGFATAVGAGGLDGDPTTSSVTGETVLADAGFDCSRQEEILEVVYCCYSIISVPVIVSGPDEVLVSQEAVFTGSMPEICHYPPVIETYTWSSDDPSILESVGPSGTGWIFRGVREGTARVYAVGNISGETGYKDVEVRFGEWYERCDLDEAFRGAGNSFAGLFGCSFDYANTANALDVDGDGVPDEFALNALAYSVCDGSVGPDVAAAYEVNVATLDAVFEEYAALLDWFATPAVGVEFSVEDVLFGGSSPCDTAKANRSFVPAGKANANKAITAGYLKNVSDAYDLMAAAATENAGWTSASPADADVLLGSGGLLLGGGTTYGFAEVVTDSFLVGGIAEALGLLEFREEFVAGSAGLSPSYENIWESELSGAATLGSVGNAAAVSTTFGGFTTAASNSFSYTDSIGLATTIKGHMDSIIAAAGAGVLPLTEAASAGLGPIIALLGADPPPIFADPNFELYVGAKASSTAFEAGAVFAPGTNPSDLTNLEAALSVQSAGGDSVDFVSLVTGTNLFATGSPFLPAAGSVVIGVLVSVIIVASARRLRRSSEPTRYRIRQ